MNRIRMLATVLLLVCSSAFADENDTNLAICRNYNLDAYTEYSYAIQQVSDAEAACYIAPRLDLLTNIADANAHIAVATDRLGEAWMYLNLAEMSLVDSRGDNLTQQEKDYFLNRFHYWLSWSNQSIADAVSETNTATSIAAGVVNQL